MATQTFPLQKSFDKSFFGILNRPSWSRQERVTKSKCRHLVTNIEKRCPFFKKRVKLFEFSKNYIWNEKGYAFFVFPVEIRVEKTNFLILELPEPSTYCCRYFAAAGKTFWQRNKFFTFIRSRRSLLCRPSRSKCSTSVWPFADSAKQQPI